MAATGGNAETAGGGALSSYRWVIVAGMVLNSWAMTLPALSFGLLLPEIRDEFGLSLSQGGWLGSSVRVGNILLTLPAGFLLSRFRPLKVVIASLVAGTVLTLMHGLATGFAVFLIARIAFGVSFSVRNPARAMLIQQWFPLREVALAQGIIIGLLGVAEFAAVYGTPLILEATGNWRFAYYVFAGFAAFTALYWIILGREREIPTAETQRRAPPPGAILRHPILWIAGLGAFCATFNWLALATFWPTFMLDDNGVSLTTSGLLFGISSLATIPMAIGIGWLGPRIRARRALFMVSGLAMTLTCVGLLYTTNVWVLLTLMIGFGMAWGYIPLVVALPFEIPRISQREISIAAALLTMLFLAGGIVGPIVVGTISDLTGSTRTALLVGTLTPIGIIVSGFLITGRTLDRRPGPAP